MTSVFFSNRLRCRTQVAQLDKIMRPAEDIVHRVGLEPLLVKSEAQTAAASAATAPMAGKARTPTTPRDVSPASCSPPPTPPQREDDTDLIGQEQLARREDDGSEGTAGHEGEEKGGYGSALLSASSRPAAAGFSNRCLMALRA